LDELTPVEDGWTPVEPEVEAEPEVEVDPGVEAEPEVVETEAVAPVETVPGIVYALSVPRRPTPAIAPKARLAVSRLSIRFASSRARILVSFILSVSMFVILARGSEYSM
jgi:hypothetical protein